MPADAAVESLRCDRALQIFVRVRSVVSDEVEKRIWMPARDQGERPDQIRHVASVEDRADKQHAVLVCGPSSAPPAPHARRYDVHAVGGDAQGIDQLAA